MSYNERDSNERLLPSREQQARSGDGRSSVYRSLVDPGRARKESYLEEKTNLDTFKAAAKLATIIAGVTIAAKGGPKLLKSMESAFVKAGIEALEKGGEEALKLARARKQDLTLLYDTKILQTIATKAKLPEDTRKAILAQLDQDYLQQSAYSVKGYRQATLRDLVKMATDDESTADITRAQINKIASSLKVSSDAVLDLQQPGVLIRDGADASSLTNYVNIKRFTPEHKTKEVLKFLSERKIPLVGIRPLGTLVSPADLADKPSLAHFSDDVTLSKYGGIGATNVIHTKNFGTYSLRMEYDETQHVARDGKPYVRRTPHLAASKKLGNNFDLTVSNAIARADAARTLNRQEWDSMVYGKPESFYHKMWYGPPDVDTNKGSFLDNLFPGRVMGMNHRRDTGLNYGGSINPRGVIDVGGDEVFSHTKNYKMHLVDRNYRWNNNLNAIADTPARSLFEPLMGPLLSKFGISTFKPGRGPMETIAKSALIFGGTGYLAYQGATYGDFLVQETTGVSPLGAIGTAVKGLEYYRSKIFERIGLTSAAETLDQEFQGSMSGETANFVKILAAPVIGSLLGRKFMSGASTSAPKFMSTGDPGAVAGFMLGGAFGALFMGDLTKRPDEVLAELEGSKRSAVRKGANWFLGRDPYSGGTISHHTVGFNKRAGANAHQIAAYGSEDEYWQYGTMFPTPHNWFGLKPLLNPYYAEQKNYHTRPYPVTGGFFDDVPLAGPILSATVGQVIKPTQYRSVGGDVYGSGVPGMVRHIHNSESGWTGDVSPLAPYTLKIANDPTSFSSALGKTMTQFENFVGLRGFYSELVREKVLGQSGIPFRGQMELASSSSMTSASRGYYGSELYGGGMSFTEPLRRFIQRDPYVQTYNELPNTMPTWLPGSRSHVSGDQNYSLDFHKGDPYTKIAGGEARLPGPAYEALNKIAGGSSYNSLDQFFILADVAPTSSAYQIAKQEASNMMLRGEIRDPYLAARYAYALEEAEEKKNKINAKGDKRAVRHITEKAVIQEVLSASKIVLSNGEIVTISNIHSKDIAIAKAIAKERDAGPVLARLNSMEREQMEFLKGKIGSSITLRTAADKDARYAEGAMEAEIDEYTSYMQSRRIPTKQSIYHNKTALGNTYDFLGKSVGEAGFLLGLGVGAARAAGAETRGKSAYHVLASSVIGGVVGGLIEQKFTGNYTSAEHYEHFNLRSTPFAGWNDPYENFIRGWFHEALGKVFGEGYVPGYRKDQRDIENYFDVLKYEKYSRLSHDAQVAGDLNMSEKYRRQGMKTMVSMTGRSDLTADTPGILSALPRQDVKYFNQFANTKDTESRVKILASVSEQTATVLLTIWKNQLGKNKEFSSSLLQDYYNRLVVSRQRLSDKTYASLLAHEIGRELPNDDHIVWAANYPVGAAKVKFLSDSGRNIHTFGYWESELPGLLVNNQEYSKPYGAKPYNMSSSRNFKHNMFRSRSNMGPLPKSIVYNEVDMSPTLSTGGLYG